MSFSLNVRNSFEAWARVPTWHTRHTADDKRFYKFVWSVLKYSRRKPSEQTIRQEILKMWSGKLEAEYLRQRATEYAQLYDHLYAFGKVKNIWRKWP
mgnify:CR=1